MSDINPNLAVDLGAQAQQEREAQKAADAAAAAQREIEQQKKRQLEAAAWLNAMRRTFKGVYSRRDRLNHFRATRARLENER